MKFFRIIKYKKTTTIITVIALFSVLIFGIFFVSRGIDLNNSKTFTGLNNIVEQSNLILYIDGENIIQKMTVLKGQESDVQKAINDQNLYLFNKKTSYLLFFKKGLILTTSSTTETTSGANGNLTVVTENEKPYMGFELISNEGGFFYSTNNKLFKDQNGETIILDDLLKLTGKTISSKISDSNVSSFGGLINMIDSSEFIFFTDKVLGGIQLIKGDKDKAKVFMKSDTGDEILFSDDTSNHLIFINKDNIANKYSYVQNKNFGLFSSVEKKIFKNKNGDIINLDEVESYLK